MTPRIAALIRLYGVQAAWTYERMAGIGVGHASAPLLRDLYAASAPAERRAAVARSAEFFNSHPYLAGIAVGAVVRAERDGVEPAQISRLRIALSGPLGAIGDQLIWAGQVPALMGLALSASPWAGAWVVGVLLVAHNVARLLLTSWGLDLGLREGLGVGSALSRSWIARRASDAQRVAAFGVGLATPIAAWQLLGDARPAAWAIVGAITLVGSVLALAPGTRSHVSGLRVGLGLLAVAGVVIGGHAMIERHAEIVNGLGLHARPAAQFVKLATTFVSSIEIECDGERANGKSIMGVMMLAAECGASVHLFVDGPDEEAAASALMALIARGFGEK